MSDPIDFETLEQSRFPISPGAADTDGQGGTGFLAGDQARQGGGKFVKMEMGRIALVER